MRELLYFCGCIFRAQSVEFYESVTNLIRSSTVFVFDYFYFNIDAFAGGIEVLGHSFNLQGNVKDDVDCSPSLKVSNVASSFVAERGKRLSTEASAGFKK